MENNNQSDQNINPRIRAIVLGVHRIYNLRNTQQTSNENDQQQNRDDGDTEEDEMEEEEEYEEEEYDAKEEDIWHLQVRHHKRLMRCLLLLRPRLS